jgi:hypothetical protein
MHIDDGVYLHQDWCLHGKLILFPSDIDLQLLLFHKLLNSLEANLLVHLHVAFQSVEEESSHALHEFLSLLLLISHLLDLPQGESHPLILELAQVHECSPEVLVDLQVFVLLDEARQVL